MTLETAKDVFYSPQEKAKQKSLASKAGKKIAPLISSNPAYNTTEQKINSDPEMAEFLKLI